MPTISESQIADRQECIKQCVKDFVEAERLSIDDSIDVLCARLFGLGLRGQDLSAEIRLADMAKFERNHNHPFPGVKELKT